ncbi:hypothetical protein, partial [Acidithiobacillus thiooxidans]|uniref:hypothetical protein n=4 Tax=Acidithiobacillus thiooxidans TaxID=930 RepID=UPI001A7E1901
LGGRFRGSDTGKISTAFVMSHNTRFCGLPGMRRISTLSTERKTPTRQKGAFCLFYRVLHEIRGITLLDKAASPSSRRFVLESVTDLLRNATGCFADYSAGASPAFFHKYIGRSDVIIIVFSHGSSRI